MKKSILSLFAAALLLTAISSISCSSNAAKQAEADSIARADSIAKADSIARADSIANVAKIFSKAPDKLREFYRNYVFGTMEATGSVIDQYCTEKLAQKLRDDYEYEGGGYAIWDFRSGNQDGDSDASALTDVEDLGDGKFKVHYFDMGVSSSCIVTCIVSGDDVLFDEIDTSEK